MKRHNLVILFLCIIIIVQGVAIIFLLSKKPEVTHPQIKAGIRGKIALVLDDWGYRKNTLETVKQIGYPLTMAVLPNLAYSKEVSQELNDMGFEIILHLPLEPHEKVPLEKNTILSAMASAQISEILNSDLANIKFAKGISNHMGSKLTESREAMSVILSEAKKKKLYFLDSLVTADSVCSGLARKLKVKFAKRDVFIDNIETPGYIKMQIYKLAARARQNGSAIGIGHDRMTTINVLKEIMPELAKDGYRFVFVSDLAR